MHKSIYAEVEKRSLPLLQHYQEDLTVHDKQSIAEDPKCLFLHFTGRTGTHMIRLVNSESYPERDTQVPYLFTFAGRDRILDDKVSVVRSMRTSNRQDLILYFDGEKLEEITQDLAVQIICDYRVRILREWEV